MLRVPLGRLAPLLHGRRENFNPRKVNVLFLQPAEGKGSDIVNAISSKCLPPARANSLTSKHTELVHEKFSSAGMLAGAPMEPARINMTLINTANRPSYVPAPGKPRQPFRLEDLYQLKGFNAFRDDGAGALPERLEDPLSVNLGVAEVSCLKLDRVRPGLSNDEVRPESEAEVTFTT